MHPKRISNTNEETKASASNRTAAEHEDSIIKEDRLYIRQLSWRQTSQPVKATDCEDSHPLFVCL